MNWIDSTDFPLLPRPYVPRDAENPRDFYTVEQMHSYVLADRASRAPAQEGWQLVPKEPTPEMVRAGWEKHPSAWGDAIVPEIYKAMLAAAPSAEAQAPQTSIEASQTTNWRINIDHAPIPILATDHIDDMPTGRDDLWIATTPHLREPQAPAAQPLTDGQISKMYAKWDKKAGTSIADLIRMVEAHHGIAPPAQGEQG